MGRALTGKIFAWGQFVIVTAATFIQQNGMPHTWMAWMVLVGSLFTAVGMHAASNTGGPGSANDLGKIVKLLVLSTAGLLLGATATAQSSQNSPALSTTTQASYLLIAGQNEAAVDQIGEFKMTTNVAMRTDNIYAANPGITFDGAGPKYSFNPKNTPWQICGYGEGGAIKSETGTHFASDLGGCVNLDIKGSKTFDLNLVDASWIYGLTSDAGKKTLNSFKLAVGIKISF